MSTPVQRTAGLLLLAAAVAATAAFLPTPLPAQDQPATPPTPPAAVANSPSDDATTRPARHRRPGPLAAEAPTDEEWAAIVSFMSTYSPNRLKAVEEYADTPRYASLRKLVAAHYRDLVNARERGDTELYDLRVAVIQKDDEVWALQRQLREATDPERPVLRYNLKQKIGELVRLGLKERELRIARLEKALGDEKARLAADQNAVDQRITERFQSMTAGLRSARPYRPRDPNTTSTDTGSNANTSQTR